MSNRSNIVNLFYPINSNEYLMVTVKKYLGAGQRGVIGSHTAFELCSSWRQHAVFRYLPVGVNHLRMPETVKLQWEEARTRTGGTAAGASCSRKPRVKVERAAAREKDNIQYAIQVLDDFVNGRASPMEFKLTKRRREGSCQLVSMGAVAYHHVVQLIAYPMYPASHMLHPLPMVGKFKAAHFGQIQGSDMLCPAKAHLLK
ncbi:hypothetical protein EDD85DRAFT_797957 [Armillaria nabsnona]|nr:hypothetical protein EDD85DRAFT_797957 [Armillaria nabsnona]